MDKARKEAKKSDPAELKTDEPSTEGLSEDHAWRRQATFEAVIEKYVTEVVSRSLDAALHFDSAHQCSVGAVTSSNEKSL